MTNHPKDTPTMTELVEPLQHVLNTLEALGNFEGVPSFRIEDNRKVFESLAQRLNDHMKQAYSEAVDRETGAKRRLPSPALPWEQLQSEREGAAK